MELSAATSACLHERELILGVDDNPVNRTMLEMLVSQEGYRIELASSGEECLEKARTIKADLVMMDVMMGGIDGFEACRQLKELPHYYDVPVIFMTAVEDVQSKLKAFSAGAVDYLTKPFYPAELLARLRIHLRFRTSYQALVRENLHQLRTMREAQAHLLPKPEDFPEAQFACFHRACHAAGGDFCDIFRIKETVIDYVVADISGHDVDAFVPTSALKALLRQNAALAYSPEENLKLLNTHLKEVFKEGQYCTLAYLRLDRGAGVASYFNAGHLACLVLSQSVSLFGQDGDPIGCFQRFEAGVERRAIRPGERLYIFSDGLIETVKGKPVSRSEGLRTLQDCLVAHRQLPLEASVGAVVNELHPVAGQPLDDLLLLGIQC